MSSKLADILNEMSLLLVMTSEGDEPGIKMLREYCGDIVQLEKGNPDDKELIYACESVSGKESSPEFFAAIQKFVPAALNHLERPGEGTFPDLTSNAASASANTINTDLADSVDQRFLTEYIEIHTLQLEEFEASLMEHEFKGGDVSEFTTNVKRYLHSLKGDSGSIGLIGVEKVCHFLEDLLTGCTAIDLVPLLTAFKEWAMKCFEAYAAGATPPELSESFMQRIKAACALLNKKSNQAEPRSEAPPAQKQPAGKTYKLSGEMDVFIEFATEAEEHLNNVETELLNAEGSYSKELVDTLFRAVHSLKGGSAYFTLEEMTKSSHKLENIMSEVRDGQRQLDQALVDIMLKYVDLQKDALSRAKAAISREGALTWTAECEGFLSSLEDYAAGRSVSLIREPETPVSEQANRPEAAAAGEKKGEQLNVKNFVKVDTTRLDLLIDSIGEMMIYSSMLIRQCREHLSQREDVMNTAHRVEKFSRDLQDIGMSMRLVPIKGLFQKMSRLVWDTSKKLGKEIDFAMEGEDTELDRNLIDKLADPLMHMVRNSIDHGIEAPDERVKKGKNKRGLITLSASHSGGSIHIKVQDDGKGLNPEKLLSKAIEKNLISADHKLSEQEIFQLIFAAGFSTAAAVTDLSGRGVGMDVVRRNVESLRGRISIESAVDKGSIFTIELPLTLAIIDGIQVSVGLESFIIPSLSIVEFIRPKREMLSSPLDAGETFHFRGRYLPIFRLSDVFGIDCVHHDPVEATIVVVDNNHEQVALMVDDIVGEYSTVIKNLGPMFEEGRGVAGCAIMPRGDVALIIDIRSLVQLARSATRGTRRVESKMQHDPDAAMVIH